MDYKQIYEITNTITKMVLGDTEVVAEDLSNLVDIGTKVFNSQSLDKYVNALVDHVGKMVFDNRIYKMKAPSVLMDSWEYGQILEKVRGEMPEAVENETWELEDGKTYDENIFHKPVISAKFFDKRTTFEVEVSITERQAKGAFSNANQMGAFISMIYTKVENALEVRNERLIMSTICASIAETYHAEVGTSTPSTTTGVKAINLLKLYNDETGKSLTFAKALTDLDFLKYASFVILLTSDHMTNLSKLFNVGGTEKFTPKDSQHVVLLSEFAKRADMWLQSDTWHNELTALPKSEHVSYWQGTGTKFDLDSCAKIDVITPSGDKVTIDHCIGCIFDTENLAVTNFNRRVTSKWNAKAEFTNYFHKVDAGYMIDLDENMVVFYMA
jgi:hypothetical protein